MRSSRSKFFVLMVLGLGVGFGLQGQEKLKAGRVLVIGSGGLGSPVLLYLAAAGVGHIGIVDFDTVDDRDRKSVV